MRLFIIIASLLVACKSKPTANEHLANTNFKSITIELSDSLGAVTALTPKSFDTSFTWTRHSDCSTCGDIRYRVQPKERKIFKENGWYWYRPNDSIEQITIEHPQNIWLSKKVELIDSFHHAEMIKEAQIDLMARTVKMDTIQSINGRPFSIVVIDEYDAAHQTNLKGVYAATLIKGNRVRFKYELISKRTDSSSANFIQDALKLVAGIKIKNGA